jgi:hypothetical protein
LAGQPAAYDCTPFGSRQQTLDDRRSGDNENFPSGRGHRAASVTIL